MLIHPNTKAFMDMLAWSEGTDRPEVQKSNCRGYDVQYGGGLITCFADHPGVVIQKPHRGRVLSSSACGRYQFLRATWRDLKAKLKLKDFSPESQDQACVQLLKECGALPHIVKGEFSQAVKKACTLWASLPGAGYNQLEHRIESLRVIYLQRGGTLK